jgi:hypothetical protein
MPEDQLRSIVDGIRARLQSELDTQLGALAESHEHALAELGRNAEAEAERRWAGKLEAARAEWTTQLQSEVAAARSDVERRMVAESMRARLEAEQASAEAATQARRELEQALAAERKRAEDEVGRLQADVARLGEEVTQVRSDSSRLAAELEETRNRANQDVEEARKKAEREMADARDAFERERAATADELTKAHATAVVPSSSGNGSAGILDAIREIDNSTSLSTALAAVTRAAASLAPRAAMFVVHGSELHEWPVDGVSGVDAGPIRAEGREAGFLSDVLRSGEAVAMGQGGTPPAFARLEAGASALAVPFTLGGQPVAVLYADDGQNGNSSVAWSDGVQILGRHASAFLAYLTALKTAQAMHLVAGGNGEAWPSAPNDDDAQGARRYARLLVSEIKLYNEGAVRVGRERRDLSRRLNAEIDRARRLYEERIPASVRERDTYFQQELVQTLAGGDPAVLG